MIKRDVTLNLENIHIKGRLYLPGKGDRSPYQTLCICHGIPSGAPPDPADSGYPSLAEKICRQGFAVFIFNFRGAGTSGGNLDLAGWIRDLKAVIDYLYALPEVDRSHLSLLGFSAGAAVSVCVVAEDTRISSVVACACPAAFRFDDPSPWIEQFRRIGAFRDKNFPPSIAEWTEGFKSVSPIDYIAGISPRPLLLVHGSDDEVVTLSEAFGLFMEAEEPKQVIVIDGAGHKLRRNDRAMAIAVDWLRSRH